ncbi:hypothetical protein HGK75_06845 [uncultured bacterium]|nr:hypothetical protein HGK75_06845 [uncultured bacterium]
MNKFLKSKWFYRLLSLVLAILLFVYVNQSRLIPSNNQNNQTSSHITQQLSLTKKAQVSIPLQLNVNSNKYFVTGYPEKVKVYLSGPSALVTTVMNTQSFKVYANLNGLGAGEHRIHPMVSGLNSELRYHLSPSIIKVHVEPRKTENFPVHVKYSRSTIANGYHVTKPVADIKSVKVSGAASSIKRIHKVVALVTLDKTVNHTVHSKAALEALDKHGRLVNVILTPSTTSVKLTVDKNNN